MKRLLFILSALILVSSCWDDDGSGSNMEYPLVADFQYNDITFFPDSTMFNTKTPEGFGYDVLNFYHQLNADKTKVNGGFTLSCLVPKSENTENLNNTYRAYMSKVVQPNYTNIYTVYRQNPDEALMPKNDVYFPYAASGTCTLLGLYVANTVEVVDSIKTNFKMGDRLTVKITGYNGSTPASDPVEVVLADYSARKDSIVSKWTAVDLDKFGAVEYVNFEVVSTNPNVPTNFCMDNFCATIKLTY